MNKLSVLLLSSNTYPSVRNSKVQKKLMLKNNNEEIYWYKQGSKNILKNSEAKLVNNDLYLNVNDDSMSMGYKTIEAFRWMYENSEFDYLFRTNTSSYLSIENLNKFIEENFTNKEFVYSGLIHDTKDAKGNKIYFASGSGYLLNRRVIKLVLENSNLWEHQYWDDVSLALLLKKFNISPTQGKRFDISGNPYKQHIDKSNYHFRCRVDNHYGYPRFLEIYVIKYLHRIFNDKNEFILTKKAKSFLFELCKLFYIHQFGWKIFSLIRSVLRFILPTKIYKLVKSILSKKIEKFKLVRFKT
tara:strand:+ start:247 stop:1146 length:900 start_codon:yes stop_codon:yes gene_type:complete